MTLITMTELKNDLKKYTELAKEEEVIITKNGKPIVKITSVENSKQQVLSELKGSVILKEISDYKKARLEYLESKYL